MNLLTRHALAATLVALVWGASAGKAGGATITSAADRPAYEALGAQQEEVVWFEAMHNNGDTFRASGILIRGATADWVLVTAHQIKEDIGTVDINSITIGNGSSYLNDRGQTSGVASMIISPEAIASANSTSKPYGDIVYLQLTTRLSSANYNLSISTATLGFDQELLMTGFGAPISLAEGPLTSTGNVMGFASYFSDTQAIGYNASMYDSGYSYGVTGSGIGSGGDSGGSVKVWNATTNRYDLAGMMVSSTSSRTLFYNFNDASFSDILYNTIRPVTAPLPVLTLTSTGTVMHLAWDATAAGFRLQTSDDLSSAGWTNLGPVITAPGTYDDPIASRPRQFYRLAKP